MIDYMAISGVIVLGLLVIAAVMVAVTRHMLVAAVALGIFSLLMALMYLLMGAPDVAMTEAAVGAGISTILLLAVIAYTGYEVKPSSKPGRMWGALVMVVMTGAMLVYASHDMPAYGDPAAPSHQKVAQHYISKSPEEIAIPNMVTAILASYRGYDTLGEAMVVFTASMSVLLLLWRGK